MKVVWSWLREFVPVEAEPEAVAERLSLGALKVESVERLGEGIRGVIVGSVVKVEDIAGADKVVLVTVDTGTDQREIVCGARNYGPGDKVPVALPGAQLPGGLEIGERTFKGRTSHGMLCSARELGLSDDHSGILVLETSAPLGTDVRQPLGLDDVVIDVEVTANRADAMSVVGIAREVAALYGLPLSVPKPAVHDTGDDAASSLARVQVRDRRGCPRYLARVVTGLSNGASPEWMRRRLTAAGMRPISAVVDATNYALLERGHPTHAFDRARLAGSSIVVRRARSAERMTTLDGVMRTFASGDLLICDAERPIGIAGVMGGADTEVSDATTEIVLEAAYFEPSRIAATARRLGLRTEASARFERGVDPNGPYAAADRVCELLVETCGGTVARGVIDESARIPARKPIRLRTSRAADLIGVPIPSDEIARMLASVEMDVKPASRTALRVIPPTFRPDVTIEEDLVEEIVRLYGYDRVPETLPAGGRIGGLSDDQRLRRLARRLLIDRGLSEAQTLSLLSPAVPDRLGLSTTHAWRRVVRLANPLSQEESVLRPSLLPGLLLAAERNAARRVRTIALFEIGTAFEPTWHDEPHGGRLPREELRVAIVLAGERLEGWQGARGFDVHDATGTLEALAAALGAPAPAFSPSSREELHPGRAAAVSIDGGEVGIAGELHPRLARSLDLQGRVAVFEIALPPLFASVRPPQGAVVPRFPAAERDLAVVVGETTLAGDVRRAIEETGAPSLESIELFDVYRGEQAGAGNVSLAYRLTFRDPERTLTDDEVSIVMQRIVSSIRERGWRPRE